MQKLSTVSETMHKSGPFSAFEDGIVWAFCAHLSAEDEQKKGKQSLACCRTLKVTNTRGLPQFLYIKWLTKTCALLFSAYLPSSKESYYYGTLHVSKTGFKGPLNTA